MISYTVATNKITVTGYSAVTPCNFTDLYNADKAGTLSLHARTGIAGTDGAGVAVDRAERPADNIVLGGASNDLYITVANWNGTTATIRITGTDRDGAAQTEDIVVNANGAFYTTKWFKTITHTQVTAFTATSFDYDLIQGQWGVVWKQSTRQFYFVSHLQIGDGSTATWFKDINKEIVMDATTLTNLIIRLAAHFQFGDKDGNDNTSNGCKLKILNPQQYIFSEDCNHGGGEGTKLYDSYIDVSHAIRILLLNDKCHEIRDCTFANIGVLRIKGSTSIVKNVYIHGGTNYGFNPAGTLGEISNIRIVKRIYGLYVYAPLGSCTFKNIETSEITSGKDIFINQNGVCNVYIIDSILSNWDINWASAPDPVIYRQYTFNLKVLDTNQNNVENATVILKDKDGTQLFSLTTNASGEITEQTVSYGYYNQANGNTLQGYSPHTIEIKKAGYKTYKKKFTMDSKIDWTIALQKVLDNNFSKRVNFNNY